MGKTKIVVPMRCATIGDKRVGDLLVEEIGAESILLVRQEDDEVKAFYNVCQHRGNKLVTVSEGSMP